MASGALNPIDQPQLWDYITIGQKNSPGYCELSEFKREQEFDVKKGKGTVGATVTFTGKPPVKGTIKFFLWTSDHFEEWESFRPLLKYDPTKKAVQAIDIYHPALADIDVKSVVCEGIGSIVHEGKQMYSCTISLLEYLPPPKKSAVSTPTGSQSIQKTNGNPPGTPPDPIADAQQKQIAELLKKASEP